LDKPEIRKIPQSPQRDIALGENLVNLPRRKHVCASGLSLVNHKSVWTNDGPVWIMHLIHSCPPPEARMTRTMQPIIGKALSLIGRRGLVLALPLALAACNQGGPVAGFGGTYASVSDSQFTLPAVDTARLKSKFLRQTVSYNGRERPGTVIVDTDSRFLYFVLPGRKAVRYGIGVGKEGMAWGGNAVIAMKKKWPTWTPTQNMVRRDPKLKKYLGGFKPGIGNPLGARAHYLYRGGQ
jgi:lipoprotein-anchoring transpeptidase ErfK/SrfK